MKIRRKDGYNAGSARQPRHFVSANAAKAHDISKAHKMAAKLRAGTVWINCYNIFDPALPFGGYKQSGWGREVGLEAVELYTELKSVCAQL